MSPTPRSAARSYGRLALLLGLALSWTMLVVLPPARAADKAAAESLFRAGKELMSQGAYAEACEKFRESHTADASVGALLNLALCNEKQGRTATAWATYREAAAMAARQRDDRRRRGALDLAAVLEPGLSTLTISVTTEQDGLEITRDGERVVAIGGPLPVDPGSHTLAATAPGFATWTTTVEVGARADRVTVTVPALTPSALGAEATQPEAGDGGPSWQTVSGVVLLGAGAVGLGVGVAFGVLAAEGESDLAQPNLCPDKVCVPGEGTDALATVKTQATVATVGVVAGSLAVVGGTVLLLLAPGAEQGDARLVPAVGPTQAGLALSGRF